MPTKRKLNSLPYMGRVATSRQDADALRSACIAGTARYREALLAGGYRELVERLETRAA